MNLLLAQYRARGIVVVPDVLDSDETERLGSEIDRVFAIPGLVDPYNLRTQTRTLPDGKIFIDRLDPFIDLSPLFLELSRDDRICELTKVLLEDDIHLFKDRVITKPPQVSGYGMHQDFPYWESSGLPPEALITAMISIDGMTVENGAVEYLIGQHQRAFNRPGVIEDVSEDDLDMTRTEFALTKPGDVLFLHPLTPHRSARNETGGPRRQISFMYNAARYGNTRESFYRDWRNNYRMSDFREDEKEKFFFR